MSVLFFMIIDTKYLPPLGGMLLESVGLKAWSGGDTGLHLTLIYFGIPFLIAYLELRRHHVIHKDFRKLNAFVLFIACVTLLNIGTSFVVQKMKSNMDGLYTIAYIDETGSLKFSYSEQKLNDLHIEFALKNYDDEDHSFNVNLNSKWFEQDRVKPIKILNRDGTLATFTIKAGESKLFVIDQSNYTIEGGYIGDNMGYGSFVEDIILSGEGYDTVILNYKSIFVKELND